MTAELWRIWVDTGGTFTDCVAVAPDGRVARAKVLSTSALRGRVVAKARRAATAGRAGRNADGGAGGSGAERPLPDDFFRGFEFAPLAAAGGVPVAGFTAADSVLTLAEEIAAAPGSRCELRSPEEAPILAARLVTGTPPGSPLPPLALRLATTRGTNALLERKGAPTALFITRGFADLLAIGTQQRPDLFALAVEKPPPYYAEVVEVEERLAADGSVSGAAHRRVARRPRRRGPRPPRPRHRIGGGGAPPRLPQPRP